MSDYAARNKDLMERLCKILCCGMPGRIGKRNWILAALALLLTLPALWTGYYQDDHLIRVRFQDFKGLPGIKGRLLDTCVFADGTPEQNHARIERGMLPWWTADGWKIAFWRPLAGLTHVVDWRLFGDRAAPMHAHSLLWYMLLVVMAAAVYHRFMPPQPAALAGLLFALSTTHCGAVSWIASRNTVMCGFFTALVVYFHDRWRRDASVWAAPAAWFSLAVGLMASEGVVSTGAYLIGYVLFIDGRKAASKWMALAPYAGIILVWRVIYRYLGYGVDGSQLYVDPILEPLQLGWNLVRYLPAYLFGHFGILDPYVPVFLPPVYSAAFFAVIAVFLTWTAYALWPVVRDDRTARFWLFAMFFSIVPVCTTSPQGRELITPSIGGLAAMAIFLNNQFCGIQGVPKGGVWAKRLAVLFVCIHLLLSAAAKPISIYTSPTKPEKIAQRLSHSAPMDDKLRQDTLLIVNLPADLLGSTLSVMRAAADEPVPAFCRTLCAGVQSLEIRRPDANTLIFKPLDNGFLRKPWCQVFRDPYKQPMTAGQVVHLTGLDITVLSVTEDGRPVEYACRFAAPLEDPSLRWIIFGDTEYVPFTVPPIGETRHVTGLSFYRIVKYWFLES